VRKDAVVADMSTFRSSRAPAAGEGARPSRIDGPGCCCTGVRAASRSGSTAAGVDPRAP
jgi:hypothetical protein